MARKRSDHEHRAAMEAADVECATVGREYLYYEGADLNEFRVPRFGQWERLRLCIDDAERRSLEKPTPTR